MKIKRRDKTRRWPFFGEGAREEGEINRTGRRRDERQATHTWGRGEVRARYIATLQAAWCNNGDIGAW